MRPARFGLDPKRFAIVLARNLRLPLGHQHVSQKLVRVHEFGIGPQGRLQLALRFVSAYSEWVETLSGTTYSIRPRFLRPERFLQRSIPGRSPIRAGSESLGELPRRHRAVGGYEVAFVGHVVSQSFQ